jgi:hypothetical protein
VRLFRRPEPWVFVILLGSYAFFWHSRDWNSASRLMLTYALVDRHTVALDGLDDQTHDIAFHRGHYYSDKFPGYSLLGAMPYAALKPVLRLSDHPLHQRGFAYWPADYWVTVCVSGFLTACAGVVLVGLARDLGCGPRRAALVGLAYGLATPAYVYATLSYGHQAASFALLASFALIWRTEASRPAARLVLAGFLAAYAAVIELQVGPVSAILGLYLLAQVIGRRRPVSSLGDFAVGALLPTLLLLGYNQLAFGSPRDFGYRHELLSIFRRVHDPQNPLGLRLPAPRRALDLLWGRHRGLLFYAPVVILAVPGWWVLARRRLWGMGLVSASAALAVFLVNLSYPNWDGGWSTGPRLLVPLLPFAMLPAAALLASGGRWATAAVVGLALAGGVLMLFFQGVGGRVAQDIMDPFREFVWPRWSGAPLVGPYPGERFTRTLVSVAFSGRVGRLPDRWQWIQFVPLVVGQVVLIAACFRALRIAPPEPAPVEAVPPPAG